MSIVTEKLEQRNIETVRLVAEAVTNDYLIGALLVIGGACLGWVARAAFLPWDYYQLAWLVPLVTLLVAWGNKRSARGS